MQRGLALALIFGSIAIVRDARADVAACAAAAEHGQDLSRAGKLTAARDALAVCAQSDCPDLIAHDCQGWLQQTESRLATVAISITDSKHAKLPTASVEMDGAPIDWMLQSSMRVDPGAHTFVVRNSGDVTVERRYDFAEGSTVAVDVMMMPVLVEPPPAKESPRGRSKGLLIGSLATSGVAVAGFALFAGFGEAGISEQSDLRGSCAPHCSSSQVDPVSTKFTIANVSAIVGIVAALGSGALWYLYARSDHHEAPITQSSR